MMMETTQERPPAQPVSWAWDTLPTSSSVMKRLPVPLSFTTTPLQCECISVDRPPLICRGCGAAFNRYW